LGLKTKAIPPKLTGEKAERRGRVEQTKRKHWVRLGALAFVLALISWAATWVGLSGTWVGDDWHMVDNYLYEDWAELAAVFKRNAASYLFGEDKIGPYRPVTMFTLIATHLLTPRPWLHHAVSWLLHAATSLLLFALLRSSGPAARPATEVTSEVVAAGLAALFFLHPVHVESYVWINGRSDLLAGFWLAALAFSLNQMSRAPRRGLRPVFVLGLVAFLGASSKLPFAIAAVAAWLAWAIRTRAPQSRIAGSAIAAGIVVHLILRAIFAPFRGQLGASENVFSDPTIWLSLPRLAANGAEALLAFRAEAMQSLSWMLFGRWSTFEWLGLAIVFLVPLFLSYRGDWPGLVYWLGALLTLAPTVIVSATFWLGFDRYLYMPAILALLALFPYVVRAASQGRRSRVPLSALGLALIAYAALQTHQASKAYASQDAYDDALLRDHFDDPGVHYYFALVAVRRANGTGLREHLSSMPSPPWPTPIIIPTYELAAKANDSVKTREAVDALVATARGGRRCETVRAQLETWAVKAPDPSTDAHLEEALAVLSCEP